MTARELEEEILGDYEKAAKEELWKVVTAVGRESRAAYLLRDVIPRLVGEVRRLSRDTSVVTVKPPILPIEPKTPEGGR